MIAYCGLACTKCPAFLATQKNDYNEKKRIAEKWSKQFNMEFKPKDISCDGCLSESGQLSGYCRKICEIRPCARGRNVKNCAYCGDYACEKLQEFLSRAPEAKITLNETRRKLHTHSGKS